MNTEASSWVETFDHPATTSRPAWIHTLRERAIEDFGRLGFPTQKSEEYRYTNVEAIAKGSLKPRNVQGALDALPIERLGDECTVVFVDGRFNPALSELERLPRGVRVGSLSDLLEGEPERLEPHLGKLAGSDRNGFYALNAAFMDDGWVLEVEAGVAVDKLLRVVHVTTDASADTASHQRHLCLVGRGAQMSIVEQYVTLTEERYLNNVVYEVFLEEDALLQRYETIEESRSAFHVESVVAQLPRSARLVDVGLSLSGRLVRRETHVGLSGEGAEVSLSGAYVPRGEEVHDQLTLVDHAVPHGTSSQLYKGVLDGRARGVFNGKVLVQRDAQQTQAYQQNRTILLSEHATADTRPQLEIYADDVKCSHGATTGELDDEALFYLRTRGLNAVDSQRLLLEAFVGEVVEQVQGDDALHAHFHRALVGALPGRTNE